MDLASRWREFLVILFPFFPLGVNSSGHAAVSEIHVRCKKPNHGYKPEKKAVFGKRG